MAEPTTGIGIVGFGWMGRVHSYAYQSIPFHYRPVPLRTRLVGVCVRRPETIGDAVARGGFEFGTADYAELLRRDDIQIINVCTPNDLHRDQVIAAIEAGKHVYCDKPLATSAEECAQIVAAVKRRGDRIINQVALQYRFYPCTMRARQLIEEGRLGRLLSFRAAYLHASLVDAERPIGWRQLPGKGGGAIADLGSHLLDLLTWLIGPIESVNADCRTLTPRRKDPATGRPIDVAADDQAVLLLRGRDGISGTAEMSKLATGVHDEMRIEIHGERGALRFNLVNPNELEFYDQADPDRPVGGVRGFRRIQTIGHYPPPGGALMPAKLSIGWMQAHIACLHNFLAAVAGGQPAHPDFQDSQRLQLLLDAAYRSNETRQWVGVPAPQSEGS